MKVRIVNLLASMVVIGGCSSMDPEMSLKRQAQSDPKYTLFNYPSAYLTTQEQNVRARIQADSLTGWCQPGISAHDFVAE
jgi:hypothetical protein